MRILTVSNLYPPGILGGYELGCSQAVEALRAAGHDVLVLTSSGSGDLEDKGVRRELRLAGVYNSPRFERLPADAQLRALIASNVIEASNIHTLARAIDEFGPDVVYLWNLFGVGGLGLVASLHFANVPWVWHLMDAVPLFLCSLTTPNLAAKNVVPVLAREFERIGAGKYVVCSQRVRDEVVDNGVNLPGDVHLIPNWITEPLSCRRRSDRDSRGVLRIMNAGQLGQHKGTDILVETAAALEDCGYANFCVDVYGLGDDSTFRGLAAKLGVADAITFKGGRTHAELLELYAEYDVFAFPTWPREPFGFAPLEAAARGCLPVISADCGIGEWLVDGVDCLKVTRDATSFARVLRAVLDGDLDVAPIVRRAESAIRREFHLDSVLPRIMNVLEDAAADGSSRPRALHEFHAVARVGEAVADALVSDAAA